MDWGIFLPDLDLEGFPDLCSHEAVIRQYSMKGCEISPSR